MTGTKPVVLDEEEAAVLKAYRELRGSGFGRLEIVVVQSRLDGISPTYHYKRRDLIPETIDKTSFKG
jgi:hypothetical protein